MINKYNEVWLHYVGLSPDWHSRQLNEFLLELAKPRPDNIKELHMSFLAIDYLEAILPELIKYKFQVYGNYLTIFL